MAYLKYWEGNISEHSVPRKLFVRFLISVLCVFQLFLLFYLYGAVLDLLLHRHLAPAGPVRDVDVGELGQQKGHAGQRVIGRSHVDRCPPVLGDRR